MEENEVVIKEESWKKKEVKQNANKLARGVLIYELIMFIVIIGDMIMKAIPIIISKHASAKIDAQLEQIMNQAMNSGTATMISIVIGLLFLLFYFRKSDFSKTLFYTNDSMSGKTFLMLLTVFMSVQVVFSLLGTGIETGINQFGFSIMGEIESASSNSQTISMFLYASFIGPITEEIVFRGFVMRGFQKYGKYYAIICSAAIFGAFHGNLIQGIFATLVGLVLGYVAMEYSIKWSILLHIINNFIFGDLLTYLTSNLSELIQSIIVYSIEGAFFIGAIVILVQKRKEFKNFISDKKVEKGLLGLTFTSVWMIIFLAFQILQGISGIERI